MEKLIKKLLIVFFIISCSGGGGSAPTDSDGSGNGDTTNPYELPNAINYNNDIPENCSPQSLAQVGTLLVNYIYGKTN